jgi:dCTP deaminase
MVREYRMIDPFESDQISDGIISYGLGSYGYDIRVADEFKIFTNVNTIVVDPKNFDANSFVEFQGEICTIPPNSFALARSVEYMRIRIREKYLCSRRYSDEFYAVGGVLFS